MNICPTECIQLTGKKHPDPTKKGKIIDTYDINFEICILCDLCTEVCPTEAIVMTNNFELAEYSRDMLFKNLEWLDENDENIRKVNKAMTFSGEFIAFMGLALVAIIGGVLAFNLTKVIHMVVALVFTFVAIAGIYVLLSAEFIAAVQILIYSGAITIIMLFGIMLTKHDDESEPKVGQMEKGSLVLRNCRLCLCGLHWNLQF